jgi:hypothetical protein
VRQRYGPSLSPDDATFKFLAHLYADKHSFMSKSNVGPGPGLKMLGLGLKKLKGVGRGR